ncbi:MAG TPA: hypothetical protein VH598_15805 [Verrucomicrobiae bacterium]|jgi:hypothetical protein|nr:hypothetical protein [Verrucomicrobiae bacterium]
MLPETSVDGKSRDRRILSWAIWDETKTCPPKNRAAVPSHAFRDGTGIFGGEALLE